MRNKNKTEKRKYNREDSRNYSKQHISSEVIILFITGSLDEKLRQDSKATTLMFLPMKTKPQWWLPITSLNHLADIQVSRTVPLAIATELP